MSDRKAVKGYRQPTFPALNWVPGSHEDDSPGHASNDTDHSTVRVAHANGKPAFDVGVNKDGQAGMVLTPSEGNGRVEIGISPEHEAHIGFLNADGVARWIAGISKRGRPSLWMDEKTREKDQERADRRDATAFLAFVGRRFLGVDLHRGR
jgi:hypothetical protein